MALGQLWWEKHGSFWFFFLKSSRVRLRLFSWYWEHLVGCGSAPQHSGMSFELQIPLFTSWGAQIYSSQAGNLPLHVKLLPMKQLIGLMARKYCHCRLLAPLWLQRLSTVGLSSLQLFVWGSFLLLVYFQHFSKRRSRIEVISFSYFVPKFSKKAPCDREFETMTQDSQIKLFYKHCKFPKEKYSIKNIQNDAQGFQISCALI